jgi:hypothetical protein
MKLLTICKDQQEIAERMALTSICGRWKNVTHCVSKSPPGLKQDETG